MKHLTAFTFGYEGWGSSGKELLDVTAAVEAARRFGPPMFVDARIRRTGRARDFRETAFEKLAGKDRYVWMPRLGNQSVVDGGDEIRISDPSAAADLADLVDGLARGKRRVIFFCWCPRPMEHGAPACHRSVVPSLLLDSLRARRRAAVVEEWPGGEPADVVLQTGRDVVRKLGSARPPGSVPLPPDVEPAEWAGLPYASRVWFQHEDEAEAVLWLVEPARRSARGWSLPLLETGDEVGSRSWRTTADRFRTSFGWESRHR